MNNIFTKNNYVFQNKKYSEERSKGFFTFPHLFNVWPKGRQWDAHICFCDPPAMYYFGWSLWGYVVGKRKCILTVSADYFHSSISPPSWSPPMCFVRCTSDSNCWIPLSGHEWTSKVGSEQIWGWACCVCIAQPKGSWNAAFENPSVLSCPFYRSSMCKIL